MTDAPASLRDGRYRVLRVLGEGAQATTFDAVDDTTGLAVAVKRFRVRGAKSWKEVELAEREAKVLAGLSHPALPRYVDHFEERGELFLVTEKIEGESLQSLRARGVSFGERDVLRLLRDVAAVLRYLHGRAPPIIHRDIKPSNVIRRPDGSFALIDFGAVRDRMKPEGGSTVVGTFGFMAPEQFQGRAMPASDVYATGATALALLSGREPEELPHRGLGLDVSAALAGSRVSSGLVRALAAMLVPDPDQRATSIETALAGVELPPSDRGARPSRHEGRRARREARHEERRRRREARRGRGFSLPALIRVLLMVALTAAQIAVFLALQVAAPMVLTVLSLFLGKGLRQAAETTRSAGKQARQSIARARDELISADTDAGPEGRVRVDVPPERPRVDTDELDTDEDDEEEEDVSAPAAKMRR